jgi:hypothetical protein
VRQEQFLLMRKRRQDAFEARQARRNVIPTPPHSIILMANHLTITSFNSRKLRLAITSFSSTLLDIFVITEPATHPQPTKISGYSSISASILFSHVLLYIHSSLLPHITVISLSDNLIHITLKLLHTAVHIFGIYGPAQQLPYALTHLPSPLPPHSLLIGGFNARHPSWDPTHPGAAINHNGRFLRNQLDSQFLSIEKDIFKPAHYPNRAQYHPTIIDLIISTLSMSNYIISTETHSPNTPSDHTAITTTNVPLDLRVLNVPRSSLGETVSFLILSWPLSC